MGEHNAPRVGSFARWLSTAVRTRRIPRARLAADLEVSGASLSRWINGVELPSEQRAVDIIDHVVLSAITDRPVVTEPMQAALEFERDQGLAAWREDKIARRRARSPEASMLAAHLTMLHAETRKALRQLTVLDGLIARLAADFGGEVDDTPEGEPAAPPAVNDVVVHDFVELIRQITQRRNAEMHQPHPPIFVEIKRSAVPAGAGEEDA